MRVILLGIFISAVFSSICYIFKASCLHQFITGSAIEIMGIMLSINCASVASLHLKLVEQEEKVGCEQYKKTKSEIRQNTVFSIFSFLFAIVLLFAESIIHSKVSEYIIDSTIMAIFLLQIYAVYEITVRFILNIKPLIDDKG